MEVGIIGLPGSGKTTLLNALTRSHAETGYFSNNREPNLGMVKVPDPRLDELVRVVQPKRTVQAELSLVDVPGQSPDMGKTQGIRGEYLLAVSQVDELMLVVRGFETPSTPPATPEDDLATMELELTFADLTLVERRLARLEDTRKGARSDDRAAIDGETGLLERLQDALKQGTPIRALGLSDDEERAISGFTLLTTKPLVVVLNLSEADAGRAEDIGNEWRSNHRRVGNAVIALPVKLEEELAELGDSDAAEFRESLGAARDVTGELLRLAQEAAGLITFFTAGDNEVRAWQLERGTSAPKAAGKKIHSDMERGFIRAEVIQLAEFLDAGGFVEARRRGTLRQEGKGYVIQDEDLVTFLFNVSGR